MRCRGQDRSDQAEIGVDEWRGDEEVRCAAQHVESRVGLRRTRLPLSRACWLSDTAPVAKAAISGMTPSTATANASRMQAAARSPIEDARMPPASASHDRNRGNAQGETLLVDHHTRAQAWDCRCAAAGIRTDPMVTVQREEYVPPDMADRRPSWLWMLRHRLIVTVESCTDVP